MATTAEIHYHPQVDAVVFNPTAKSTHVRPSAPLASVESLADVVSVSSVDRMSGTPSTCVDSGRVSAGTSTATPVSLSTASTSTSSGVDTASFSAASVHFQAPAALDGEEHDDQGVAWPPPGDPLGEEVDGWWSNSKPEVDVPVNLAFQKLSYTVHTRVRIRRQPRRILHGVSGEFRSGQLTAIMGPSGAGKSTLLDILSGYKLSGFCGRLLLNGSPRDPRTFHYQSAYIQQENSLHPQLTVKEAMNVAAVLKLGGRGQEARDRVTEVLQSLGLLKHVDTMTARLSGGQQKRLGIALELLSNPPVMFFDEPTSGLDSSTTKQCVNVLRRLSRQGRTVVCTIHQPSATVFEMLDQLYLLDAGRCAYSGHTANLLPYLAGLGLRCPPYHNPADYALEVTGGEYGDHSDELVRASENGRCQLWTTTTTAASDTLAEKVGTLSRQSSVSGSVAPSAGESGRCGKLPCTQVYPTTFWMQLYVLIKRAFLKGLRDRMLCHSRLYVHLVAGLLIGALFLDIGADAAHVFHNFSLLFFCLMFLMFTAFSAMILAFPLEMPMVAGEHFNRWYSLKAYFLAVTMADVPLQGACTCIYTALAYFLTSQPMEPTRFLMYLLICSLVSFVAQSVGLVVGAAMKVEHGVIFGPLAILPFTIFSGYFVHQRDAPVSMQWLFDASFLKYGLSGSMLSVYGYDRETLGCSDDYCHFKRPEKFLHELNLDGGSYWWDVAVLFAIGSVLRLAAYFVLRVRLQSFR